MLECRHVFKKFDGKMVVKDCNFSVQKGEMIGLMGESGSGKSTLAKLLLGLEKPSQGEILLDSQPYSVKKSGVRILLVFQDSLHSVNPNFTVEQVLTEALPKDVARGEIEAILEDVGLEKSFLNQPARQLSGGQLQRICIARGLLLKPDILIFDEALSGLDPIVQGRLLRLLYDLWEKYQLTYLFISHDFKLSYALCHRILVMADGEIVDEIKDFELPIQAHHPVTKKLIGDKGHFS
ncbi:ATP-binding cassette domain-containing protein [Streptococcus sp. 27098_8_134]|uniref:Nickel ABC superfamily ATP binding cassette transporter, ABC protein n=1 Tax=Streptococcus sanguinis SK1087 TaxID=888824 RepID=F3SJH2_STRSA|nr:ATP-binding cassette domain-containing protein [Streptococcus sanguinis]EGF05257.1 nickel ABC superfamily ATP binding cassette transporter, ABC protein [Streptococcus sanguinis SK1057]EGG39875.1 nickel ABC superfamily ATP binding cassette transporter, ABC protein [Streptococcus sanguinis SK1087]